MHIVGRRFYAAGVWLAALCALSGAAGAGAVLHTPVASPPVAGEILYVADSGNATIVLYDALSRAASPRPIGRISAGITNPVALATDMAGDLYVANASTASTAADVEMYVPGSLAPNATYTSGISTPIGVAVDGRSTLYVANAIPAKQGKILTGPSIVEFATGSTTPAATVSDPNAVSLAAIAVDGQRNVYVSGRTYLCCPPNAVDELVPGPHVPLALAIAEPVEGSGSVPLLGLALDASGNLVAADGVRIFGYAPTAAVWPAIQPPAFTITVRGSAPGLALDERSTRLFTLDAVDGLIYAYAYPSGQLETIYSDSVFHPSAVTVGPAPVPPARLPQPPTPPRAAPPPTGFAVVGHIRSITLDGARTLKKQDRVKVKMTPTSLAVDTAGHIYAFLSSLGEIAEFNQGGSTPLQTFMQGLLQGIGSVAVAADGTVAAAQFSSVVVFPLGIQASMTLPAPPGTDGLNAVALDTSDDVYVAGPSFSGYGVYEYVRQTGGYAAPQELLTTPSPAESLVLDASGNLVAATSTDVYVYPRGQTVPQSTIGQGLLSNVDAISLDATNHFLYVALEKGDVFVFRYPTGTPYGSFPTGEFLESLALSPASATGPPWNASLRGGTP